MSRRINGVTAEMPAKRDGSGLVREKMVLRPNPSPVPLHLELLSTRQRITESITPSPDL